MKSITKKISLLLILSAVLFLSSCLDAGSESVIRNNEASYITKGSVIYARTQSGYLITSPKIKTLTPGTIALLSYQITEDSKTETVDENVNAFVAEIGADPITLVQTILIYDNAPEVTPVKFESLLDPFYRSNQYFGDRWIFSFQYKAKKGENAKVNFYKASNEEAKAANSDVLIDIRLKKLGTADEGASEKLEANNIVVDMSGVRLTMADKADENGNLRIKFRYFKSDSGSDDIYISPNSYTMLIDK